GADGGAGPGADIAARRAGKEIERMDATHEIGGPADRNLGEADRLARHHIIEDLRSMRMVMRPAAGLSALGSAGTAARDGAGLRPSRRFNNAAIERSGEAPSRTSAGAKVKDR